MELEDPARGLLRYEAELIEAGGAPEVAFIAVNRLASLLPFRTAVLLRPDPVRHARAVAVSHLYEVDENAPFCQWLARLVRHSGDQPTSAFTAETVPQDLAQDWGEWLPEHAVVCRLKSPNGTLLGWMVVALEEPLDDQSSAVLELACRKVALVLAAWQGRDWLGALRKMAKPTRRQLWIAGGVTTAVLLFPVRLSTLGPAEVTALSPASVTAPVDGVLAKFQVAPNTLVKAGDVVAVMDDTVVRNRHTVALKGLEIARAELARAGSKAFGDDQSRSELLTLKARVDEKQAEVAYNEDLLQRLQLRTPVAGLVIYSSPDEWEGRALATGERIAKVADPGRAGLTVHLAPEDAIAVEPGNDVRFYQNVSPLSALAGKLTQVGYEAESTVDAGLAYVLKAEFESDAQAPRLGLRGTAKVYGGFVPLVYYVLRRPIASLRRLMGI